ncbi:hypothetical protein ACFOWM_06195 [Ferruginibacter yonginensis]|uniref:Uncharacterized protein n=1 Tax=Ferruginibacter yonginensis TaxID=1310416 RepID=A0ABV8QS64_9BACT
MKKGLLIGLAILVALILLGVIFGKRPTSTSKDLSAKLYQNDTEFKNDLKELTTQFKLSEKQIQCLGFYISYRSKNDTALKTMTYARIIEAADSLCKTRNEDLSAKESFSNTADTLNNAFVKTKWLYDSSVDKMTSDVTYTAVIQSNSDIQLHSPYGATPVNIMIRKRRKETDVILSINEGQFYVEYNSPQAVLVRFDDDKAYRLNYSEAADGSSNYIFLNAPQKFIAQIKKSKKLLIEAGFYQDGLKQIDFDIEGLVWDK